MELLYLVDKAWKNSDYPVSVRVGILAGHEGATAALIPETIRSKHIGIVTINVVDQAGLFSKDIQLPWRVHGGDVITGYTIEHVNLFESRSINSQAFKWITQAEILALCSRYHGLSSKEHATLFNTTDHTAAKHIENVKRKIRPRRLSFLVLSEIVSSYDAIYQLLKQTNPYSSALARVPLISRKIA